MTTRLRTALFTATVTLASLSAFVTSIASATERDTDAHAAYVEQMARIGLTPRFDAVAAPAVADVVATDEATRQREWAERQRLAGRTLRWDERAPAELSAETAPRSFDEALAQYRERATAAGRTVQWHEVHAAGWARDLDASTRASGASTLR